MLVRDRLGKKPLLYAQLPDGSLAFASETKALLTLPGLPRELDLAQLDAFLALQYVPRSGLRAVEKVPPGSYAVVENGAVRVERYWSPEAGRRERRAGRAVDRARPRRGDARRCGGGSSPTCRSARCSRAGSTRRSSSRRWRRPRRSRCARSRSASPTARYDERAYARAVAERYGTRARGAGDRPRARSSSSGSREAFDEPFGDEAALPTLLVCEATRRHVKVALVGDGGDEVFGGYERYRAHALAGRVPAVRGRRWERMRSGGCRGRGASHARRSSARAGSSTSRRQPAGRALRAPRRGLPARAAPAALDGRGARARRRRRYLPAADDLRLVDIESYLPGDLLPKADLASMAVSLELRSPFLDHRVVELGLALPPELAAGKTALKQAFAADLPPEIAAPRQARASASRSTAGSARSCGRSPHDLLLGGEDRGLFRRAELKRLLGEHADGRADHGHRLWCLCMLELWQRHARRRRRGRRSPPRERARRRATRRRRGVCVLPRLAVLLHERGDIVSAFTEKSWRFANTFLDDAAPSASSPARRRRTRSRCTRLFLIPIYWVFDQSLARGRRSRRSPSRSRPRCSSTRSAAASPRRAGPSSRP